MASFTRHEKKVLAAVAAIEIISIAALFTLKPKGSLTRLRRQFSIVFNATTVTKNVGSPITFTATVIDAGGTYLSGASLTLNELTPNAQVMSSQTSNSAGSATWSFALYGAGTYTYNVTATYGTASLTSNTVTITVNEAIGSITVSVS